MPDSAKLQEEVTLGAIAHGGECVVRLPGRGGGRVVFVRGGIPGERVRIEITDATRPAWWRGLVCQVIEASPHRVEPACPVAGLCGGCDFQHIDLDHQRELKALMIAEQLRRLGGIDWPELAVEPVTGDQDGLAWRTRLRYLVGLTAKSQPLIGFRAHATHDVVGVPADGCPLAYPGGPSPGQLAELARTAGSLTDRVDNQLGVAVASSGVSVWQPGVGLLQGEAVVVQHCDGLDFKVRADGFWQVHPGAATALAEAVGLALAPQPGETGLDLYCGVGLFAATLAKAGASVFGIEANQAAVELAQANVPSAAFAPGSVERADWGKPGKTDVVVLDPPRAGAGRQVVEKVVAAQPRAVAYVACQPSSLGRDLATFTRLGYRLAGLRAFDIFPMTAHVECLAWLVPDHRQPGQG